MPESGGSALGSGGPIGGFEVRTWEEASGEHEAPAEGRRLAVVLEQRECGKGIVLQPDPGSEAGHEPECGGRRAAQE